MCGITGFIAYNNSIKDVRTVVLRMNDKLAHRGPDDCGMWVDEETGVAFEIISGDEEARLTLLAVKRDL